MCSPRVGRQLFHALGEVQNDLEPNYFWQGKPRIVAGQEKPHSCTSAVAEHLL
jgi:hypothetical protein